MNPYLSIVVAARNDNYGGNFLHRIQVFVNALLALWERYNLDAELIIVEWNPPLDRAPLRDAITWTAQRNLHSVRIIEVPLEVHQQLPNSDRMPMFEYIAKNVGIRKAHGEFVLAANPDLLFSEEIIRFLSEKRLSKEYFYRANRFDVSKPVPISMTVEEQLRFCRKYSFRVATNHGTVPVRNYFFYDKSVKLWKYLRAILGITSASSTQLHTNASGDFFLMAQSNWHALRGYPEFNSHSHIDGYMCYMAASLGLKQVILPGPLEIYHQEHDRSEHNHRPQTDYEQFIERGNNMIRTMTPEIVNRDSWGFDDATLSENRINP